MQVPLVASNRIGEEKADSGKITFYGGSFIAGPTGEIKSQVCLVPYVKRTFPIAFWSSMLSESSADKACMHACVQILWLSCDCRLGMHASASAVMIMRGLKS